MAPFFGKLGRATAKLGRRLRPRTRHGVGHLRRKHLPAAGLVVGGVALGVGGDMIANEISPDPEAQIYATGEISPVKNIEDRSFSLFHFEEDDEELFDESSHDMLLGNSTSNDSLDSLGEWHPTNWSVIHRGSPTARRIKGAVLAIIILIVIYVLYRITKRIRVGCREGDPKRWGRFPGLQIFTSPQPASPVPDPGRPASPPTFAPTYTMPVDPLDYALHHHLGHHGLTLDDFNRWVNMAQNSVENAHKVSQSIDSPPIMAYTASHPPSTAWMQEEQSEPTATTAPDSRAVMPIKDGGLQTDDTTPASNTAAALRRLRLAIQQS